MAKKKVRFMRGGLLVMLAAVMLAMAACSGKENNNGASSSQPPSSAQAGSQASSPEKRDPVTLKVEVFDRGNSPAGMTVSNNYMTKYIQQAFGDPRNITVQFVPVPRSEEAQKLNVLMATSDVPDVVFTYDINTAYKYVKQGGLTELTPLVDQYGPNLKQFMGDALEYGKFDDGLYSIVAKREFLGRWAQFIRKDWLDALNLPVPTNRDQLYTALKAFKKQDPGHTGGKTVPYGFSMSTGSFFSPIWSFIHPESEEQQFVNTQQYADMDNPVLLPGHKDALRWFNKLYNEGLISPDFGLDKDGSHMQQSVMNGDVGFFSDDNGTPFSNSRKVAETLTQNVSSADLIPFDPFQAADGTYPKPLYNPSGMYIMIPKASKHAKEAIEYLDWMSEPDNYDHLRFGEKGKHYKLDEHGYPVAIDPNLNKVDLYNAGDYKLLTTGTYWGSVEKDIESTGLTNDKFGQQFMDTMRISLKDGFHFIKLPHPLQSQSSYGETLKQKYDQLLVKSLMAKPDNFDAVYDNALKDYMNSGGNAVVKERQALWDETH